MMKLRLAGLTVAEFLHRHWQKKPLLARGALPELADFLQRDSLFELAARDDLESRLVVRHGRRWQVRHGPFPTRTFRTFLSGLRGSKWSLLVHGVNDALPAAERLLQKFAFVPHARLDDVMVSYAPPGGGVGPHFDSYDVFLAQSAGLRRWRIGRCDDGDLLPNAPLRILRRFRPRHEWVLHPGDMLYLPPHYGHDGVALTDCITVSIGFRAPSARELGARFLEYLQERLRLEGMYRDPDLIRQRHPAGIGASMIRKAGRMLDGIQWGNRDVVDFLGCDLTEPKAHIVFARPARPLAARAFARAVARRGVSLALTTRMLFRGRTMFINGESCEVNAPAMRSLARLADRRALPPLPRVDRESVQILYQWYRAGYIEVNGGG
jgi:50S ribosomal protein L16 3-hydroxylase